MYAVQVGLGNTFGCEALPHFGKFTLITTHTDIACLAIIDLFQNTLIVLMPTRYQDDVIVLSEVKRPPDVVKIRHDGRVRLWETFLICKGWPVVNHLRFKAGELRRTY